MSILYLRFTDTPHADLERKVSHHLSEVESETYEWNDHFNCFAENLPGLCGFELESEKLDDAIEEAMTFRYGSNFDTSSELDSWCIMSGKYVDDCPEGVVFSPIEILYIKKGSYYAEKEQYNKI